MGTGADRNSPCLCGSGKKQKKCCRDNIEFEKKLSSEEPDPGDLKEVLNFFRDLERDSQILKRIGIHQRYQQVIARTREGYLISLDKGIFKILSNENFSFYEVIGVIAMETLGSEWIQEQYGKEIKDRSAIYKIISILGATGQFKKIIAYEGKEIESYVPENGFSKNFLTLAFDIFCLRHQGILPQTLIERLKHFDQYQGARYELTVAAIFCRLGYGIEWLEDRAAEQKHPEFIARKEGREIYVEAKSRGISGVHNQPGVFDANKALKSKGYGTLLHNALEKEKSIPKGRPYLIFIDINALNTNDPNDDSIPKWLKQARNSITTQHLKKYLGKEAPFTSVIFTSYSYHYQGLNYPDKSVSFAYSNDLSSRPYSSPAEKTEMLDALKYYGFIPDYHIPGPMTILQKSSEFPRINNINQIT